MPTQTTADMPEVIKNQSGACHFCWWLDRHQEITNIQGYVVERGIAGKFTALTHGNFVRYTTSIDDLMGNRAVLNDWISTYRNRRKQ